MKKIVKRVISTTTAMTMIVSLFLVNVGATQSAVVSENKISDSLRDKINEIKNSNLLDEKIKVTIWYSDINQKQVEKKVEKETGLTREELLNTQLDMPDSELFSESGEGENYQKTQEYLKKTEKMRSVEKINTKEYVKNQRRIAKGMIEEKCKQVVKDLAISSKDLIFESKYAPMLIASLTVEQINDISENEKVDSIDLYVEPEILDPPWNSLSVMKAANGFPEMYQKTGLSGQGVTIGILDHGIPYSDPSLDLSKFEFVGLNPDTHSHAVNSAHIITGSDGIAPNIDKVYCAGLQDSYPAGSNFYYGVENLMTKGVSVINASINQGSHSSNSYLDIEKWLDYMIDTYCISFVQSAGNDAGVNSILTFGLCYNTITVGAMDDKGTKTTSDDMLFGYSSYDHLNGCYKPDLIAPANVLGGGTSSSAPVVTGIIALMLELKPSLAVYPQAIKAILLASCHRKAIDPVTGTQTEFMEQGLTNKQGAGVVNPFIALSIIANEQYGIRQLSSSYLDTIKIAQPPYGSSNMNVSIAWHQENDAAEYNYPNPYVNEGTRQDLDLTVYQPNSDTISSSYKSNSSTEMAYMDLSDQYFDYKFEINRYNNDTTPVLYAYAWSVDKNEKLYQPKTLEGIYYIKNKYTNNYLGTSSTVGSKDIINGGSSLWVIRKSNTNTSRRTIKSSSLSNPGWMAKGSSIDTGNTWAALGSSSQEVRLSPYMANGSYNIFIQRTSSLWDSLTIAKNNNIYGAKAQWSASIGNADNQGWYLEQLNYQKGDINMDGKINDLDIQTINQYLSSQISLGEAKLYLGDMNGDNLLSSADVTMLNNKIIELNQ